MANAILGYGKSGKAALRLLEHLGESRDEFIIYDDNAEGCTPLSQFEKPDGLIVVSPGVDYRRFDLPVSRITSEIELACRQAFGSKIIAVTGTNGKSTVTHITAQLLRGLGHTASACGNIGKTFADAVLDEPSDYYVVELSSFQTEMLTSFRADSIIITNLTPDHMDRYSGFDEYAEAKFHLLEYITDTGRITVPADKFILDRTTDRAERLVIIEDSFKEGPVLKDNILSVSSVRADITEYKLYGLHNLVNLAFAMSAASSVTNAKGDITEAVKGLTGLEHRCEIAGRVNGVTYINDSKATNVDSVIACLSGADPGVNLILGGRDKKGDFERLIPFIDPVCKRIITSGEASEDIYSRLHTKVQKAEIIKAGGLKDAFETAKSKAGEGETVILSPGCASFDEFKNFEERGKYFKELVQGAK